MSDNQPIAFGALAIGAMMLTSALTGTSFGDILKGHFGTVSTTSGVTSAGVAGVGSGLLSGTGSGSAPTVAQFNALRKASNGTESENASYLMSYFQSQGLSKAGAAALVGNFVQESGVNPSEQNGYLAQWLGSRLTNLENYAAGLHEPVTAIGVQAQFVLSELESSHPQLLSYLKSTNDPGEAAVLVEDQYESPAGTTSSTAVNEDPTANTARRVESAKALYSGTF